MPFRRTQRLWALQTILAKLTGPQPQSHPMGEGRRLILYDAGRVWAGVALNEALVERKVEARYVTLCVLLWNPATREIVMANAGALPVPLDALGDTTGEQGRYDKALELR